MPSGHAAAVRHLRKADSTLAEVMRLVGPCRLQPTGGRFEILGRSILAQQISVAAARTIHRRLRQCLPGRRLSARGICELTDEQLQSVGVSKQKRTYLRDLAEHTMDGRLNFRQLCRLDNDDVIEKLVQVKGIGVWTAQMFLLFGLGRPDVFAPADLGLKNAVAELYFDGRVPTEQELEQTAEPWAPWRSIASWYLWRYLDLDSDNPLP